MQIDAKTDSSSAEPNLADRGNGSCRERLAAYRDVLERDLAGYVRLEVRWSWLRLATFLVCVAVLAVVGFACGLTPAMIGALPALVVFRHTVLRHIDWKDKRTLTERLLKVVNESLHAGVEEGQAVRGWQRLAAGF